MGRVAERALLRDALEAARGGRPRVVLVQGPAGIGKSALMRSAITEAGDVRVLWASGDETEAGLALGVIDQLVAGISPRPPALANVRNPECELDPFVVGAALLELLSELQDGGPVVLAVDDAHWADSASLHALVFCLRRLRADRVLALLSARSEQTAGLPPALLRLLAGDTGATLELGGLAAAELVELAGALGAGLLPVRTAGRFAQHTGGNPLLAGALLEEFGAEVVSQPQGSGLRAPRSFSTIVLARLGTCTAEGRALVAAASVLGLRWPLALAAALAGLSDPLTAVDAAAAAGLVTVESAVTGPVGVFTHPLVRAAVYAELSLSRRAALHRRAAELAEDPRDVLRHRVEAAPGVDAQLTDAAVGLADRDAAAGSWAAAARGYLWAARVAPSRPDRERRLLDAVVALLFAGDLAEAAALLEGAGDFQETALWCFAHGYQAWARGDIGSAERNLLLAWQRCADDTDAQTAARAAEILSNLCVYLGRGGEGIIWARRSLEANAHPDAAANPRSAMLLGYGMSRPAAEGLAVAAGFDVGGARPEHADGLVGRGTVKLWADDPAGARADLLTVAERCLRAGPLERGMFAAVHLADAEWRLGLWDESLLHGEAAVGVAEDTTHVWFLPEAHAVAAFPLIARGEWDDAAAHIAAAVAAAQRIGYGHGSLWAIMARGRLADARGDHQQVVRALSPLLGFVAADGVDHPGLHPWRELLGAALVALGRPDEALDHATALEHQAQQLGINPAHARALRVGGLVHATHGRTEEAIESFQGALSGFQGVARPFERALIEADLGATLRRAGRRSAAAQQLDRAR
ncbi:MAG: AAA family ATPase, partial [Candidatus Dormibacteria bacterium]